MTEFTTQDLSKFRVPEGFRGRPGWYVQLWWIVQSLLFRTSPQALYGWRVFLLRIFGARIGRNVIIRPSARITYPWFLVIGDNAWVGDNAELYNLGRIEIGANAVISQGCYLCTGGHDFKEVSFPIYAKPIMVEPEAWLASQVFVCPGATIGRGAVVGARSLVTRDVPANTIVMGQPATVVRMRNAQV